MKTRLLTASLAIAFSALSPATSLARGKPTSCGPDVNVSVSFDAGYAITTADQSYLAGFQVANCSYDFTLNLFNSSPQITVLLPGRAPTTAWFFNFDRIGSVPVMDGSTLHTTWCTTPVATSVDGITYIGNQPLDNYQPCGDDGAVDPIKGQYFARRNVGFGLVDDYGLRFQVSPWEGQVGGDAVDTDYIKVYHPTANTWILEPEFEATSVLRDGSKKRAGVPTLYPMPFKAVVRRLFP